MRVGAAVPANTPLSEEAVTAAALID
jgi:hypothetical protein